jgi:response regulator RpfG family c-di-GMP phosphodiesterase
MTAESGAEAIKLLESYDFAVVISDQRMPEMTGLDLLKQAAEMRRQTVRIMLTGYTDAATLVEAINSGVVYKYLTKPWVNEELLATIKRALQHYEAMKAQRQLQSQNERLQTRLTLMRQRLLELVGDFTSKISREAGEKSRRLYNLAAGVGEAFGLEHLELENLKSAAALKEAMSLDIPLDIRTNPQALSSEKYKEIKLAFSMSLDRLFGLPELEEAAITIGSVYERYDGLGFPSGLKGEQIPLLSRILAAADALDDLMHKGRFKTGSASTDAIISLEKKAGTELDPNIVNVLKEMRRRRPIVLEESDLVFS